uniref:Uncharacterized protein n=2 Tax=Oncorhynchus tshawytscha TaxID=74940 RepID=A0AAZ3P8M5_ONCTS
MPRHLISDAHEWMNEIPTVPTYYLAKPQPRERAWRNQRGGEPRVGSRFWFQAPGSRRVRPAPGTVAGGEFDWGGTPVKR